MTKNGGRRNQDLTARMRRSRKIGSNGYSRNFDPRSLRKVMLTGRSTREEIVAVEDLSDRIRRHDFTTPTKKNHADERVRYLESR